MAPTREQLIAPVPTTSPSTAQLPGSLGQAVRLNPGENPVKFYRVRKLDPNKGDPEDDDSRTGIMLITNQRLVFIEETGVLQKKFMATETINMSEIRLVEVAGFLSKSLKVNHIRYKLNYVTAFDQFKELDLTTMKGTSSVTLVQAQQVLSDALVQSRNQALGNRLGE